MRLMSWPEFFRSAGTEQGDAMLTNDRGSFLMGLLLLISVIALMAAGAARSSLREKARVSREYNETVAQSAAESCIEQAKALIASGSPRTGEYQMGNEQFSSVEGREVSCRVKYLGEFRTEF